MSLLFGDENFDRNVVLELRRLGHDVLTAHEAGRAICRFPMPMCSRLRHFSAHTVLTFDRRNYRRLHGQFPAHAGIITCTDDRDFAALTQRIHNRISALPSLAGQLIRVTKAG